MHKTQFFLLKLWNQTSWDLFRVTHFNIQVRIHLLTFIRNKFFITTLSINFLNVIGCLNQSICLFYIDQFTFLCFRHDIFSSFFFFKVWKITQNKFLSTCNSFWLHNLVFSICYWLVLIFILCIAIPVTASIHFRWAFQISIFLILQDRKWTTGFLFYQISKWHIIFFIN